MFLYVLTCDGEFTNFFVSPIPVNSTDDLPFDVDSDFTAGAEYGVYRVGDLAVCLTFIPEPNQQSTSDSDFVMADEPA